MLTSNRKLAVMEEVKCLRCGARLGEVCLRKNGDPRKSWHYVRWTDARHQDKL